MNHKYSVIIGILLVILLPEHTHSQTKFSLTEEKCSGKQEGTKRIPTFVGSDGIERKVSPAAILDEMKRCLPPGLPIPIETAWPELPPHLESLQQAKESPNEPQGLLEEGDGKSKDKLAISQEKKRVSRSNDKNVEEMAVGVINDQGMNVKLEGPTKEPTIFSPKDINQYKMAEVMKSMLARQMRKHNMTAEYVDDFNVRSRLQKSKHLDDYGDYDDYIDAEEPKMTPVRAKIHRGNRYSANAYPTKRQRRAKVENRHKHTHLKPSRKQHVNRLRKKPDYDYEDSNEEQGNPKYIKQHQTSEDHIQSDELEKQIELNDFFEKNLNTNEGIPERIENMDQFIRRSGSFKNRSEEIVDTMEGYKKMLAVIMKLNTTLIQLLDKFSTIFQKDQKNGVDLNEPIQREDSGKSSVIWDFMDLLMQQRRGARNKRESSPYIPENSNKNNLRSVSGEINSPSNKTNMDLFKWLLKWYLSATT